MEAASSTAMCTAKTGTLVVLRTLWRLDKLRLWEYVNINIQRSRMYLFTNCWHTVTHLAFSLFV
jgi:hypothetical protein